MHIAFNGWFWDQPNTGSGQYIRHLVRHLRRLDPQLELTLILPPHNPSPDNVPDNVNVINTGGLRGKVGKIWFEQRTFPKMVAKSGADIAHVPYWGPPLSSPAKLVTSVLDMIPLVIPEYSKGIFNRLYTALVSSAAVGSAHTITISEAAKEDIIQHLNLPADSISVTYLGIDDAFHPRMGAERDEAVRQKYNLPDDDFILYLGGFDFRKQIDQVLLAYTYVVKAEGDKYPLVLAGKQPAWGTSVFPDLPAYAEELNLTDLIHWTGYIDEADKPSIYRLASVYVFPSMYEGFGFMPLEAMASGTPAVTSNIDVFEEVLGDGAYLAANVREMAGGIIGLLGQEPFRDTMTNQGLARATRYTWRKTAQQTLEVYHKVMAMEPK
ncbi:MAG: glycosyltransferase family 1 protein [Aggregatilineales bacterium]